MKKIDPIFLLSHYIGHVVVIIEHLFSPFDINYISWYNQKYTPDDVTSPQAIRARPTLFYRHVYIHFIYYIRYLRYSLCMKLFNIFWKKIFCEYGSL